MDYNRIINDIPTLGSTLRSPIYIWESFYFVPIDEPIYEQAAELSQRISAISTGRKTLHLTEEGGLTGKIGEFVMRQFCQTFLTCTWQSNVEYVNPTGGDDCDLTAMGLQLDVKTRQLHNDITIAPSFDLRVPAINTVKYQDVYVLAGYCPSSRYGYLFGWTSWEEIQSRPIRTDLRCPARCLPLSDLHPMQSLEGYLVRRAAIVSTSD